MKDLIRNKKAFHNYEILETFTAGIVLFGWEVKSILRGNCSIAEGFVDFRNREVFLKQTHVSRYKNMDQFSEDDETRDKKLLLNKSEIKRIRKKIEEKGFTAIPISIFYSDSKKIKVKLGIGKGKKTYDKRQDLKMKQHQRDMEREN